MSLPAPDEKHPLIFPDGSHDPATVFLANVIDHPNIEIGVFTYYNDRRLPEDYASTIAPYLFVGSPEKLTIGKFCQIAEGVQFITASANHPMDWISTYPFGVFDPERFAIYRESLPAGSDTIVGHDCWLGRDVMVMPGARIGNGVIVGAGAVVAGTIPDYAVVAGNPARVVRMRFADAIIRKLNALAWWDWSPIEITSALSAIESADINALELLNPGQ